MIAKIFLILDSTWQQQIVKSTIEFYLEKEKIVLFDRDRLASIYNLDCDRLPSDIDRSNYWKLDPLLENDGVTIAAIPKIMLKTIAHWWSQSNRGEKLVIWSDNFLLELELFDNIIIVISEDLKVVIKDRGGVRKCDFPQLYLSDREQKKIDNLAYRDVLNGFDLRQFSTEIKREKIDRPTYHRVRKYVDRMSCLYREIGID